MCYLRKNKYFMKEYVDEMLLIFPLVGCWTSFIHSFICKILPSVLFFLVGAKSGCKFGILGKRSKWYLLDRHMHVRPTFCPKLNNKRRPGASKT